MTFSERERECPQSAEAGAFVLGALGDEDRDYRAHLTECSICRTEVAELRLVIDAVPGGVPDAVASDELRDRVMAVVRAEAELLKAAGPDADLAPRPPRIWGPRARGLAAAGMLAATALVAAVIVGSSGPATRTIPARIAFSSSGAHAVLRELGDRGELLLSGMPQPPRGKIYEVWVQRARNAPAPTDALFTVTSRGSGSVGVPGSLGGVREVLVSAEPLGGSRRLTGPVLIQVSVSS
jgi:hypothetical protein